MFFIAVDLSLFKDESQLKKRKSNADSKQKRQRNKSKRDSSDSEDEEDSEEDSEDEEKVVPKASPAKKRSANKTLAIAKSVAKGPSRKERAINRSNKTSGETVIPPSAPKLDNTKKTVETKKDEAKKPVQPQSNNTSGVPRTKARGKS